MRVKLLPTPIVICMMLCGDKRERAARLVPHRQPDESDAAHGRGARAAHVEKDAQRRGHEGVRGRTERSFPRSDGGRCVPADEECARGCVEEELAGRVQLLPEALCSREGRRGSVRRRSGRMEQLQREV